MQMLFLSYNLASKTKNEHFGVLDSFISFLRKHGKKKIP